MLKKGVNDIIYDTNNNKVSIKLNNTYINELVEGIINTEIWKTTSRKAIDYDEGISWLLDIFKEHKKNCSKVFFIGNGGSAAIASHMTADYLKNGGMNTYSLYDNAVTTCMGNDYGYDNIFSRPIKFLVNKNDLVVAISSSGNSQNILNAILAAKDKGADVVTFTGFLPDNKARHMGDLNVYIPVEKYGIVESIHNLILQHIVDKIMEQDGMEL